MQANVDGTTALLRAARAVGVQRIVYCSSVAALGLVGDGTPGTEETPVDPAKVIGVYKQSKYLAEQAVRALVRDEGVPAVIVNPSAPVGPRDIKPTPTGKMVLDAAAGQMPAYVDTGLNIVHVDDVAEGHVLALEHGRLGESYILGGEDLGMAHLLAMIDDVMHRAPQRRRRDPERGAGAGRGGHGGRRAGDGAGADGDARDAGDGAEADVLLVGQGAAGAGLQPAPGARGAGGRDRLVQGAGAVAVMLAVAPPVLAIVAALAWAYLLLGHGRFWSAGPVLAPGRLDAAPALDVVVPARDEAEGVGDALRSLLAQDYPGVLRVILVDDGSSDGTGDIARALGDPRLTVIEGAPHPPGWSGKLWAVSQGVAAGGAGLVLLTDADIVHDPLHLATLVGKLERDGLHLVSEMVELRCASWAERALVPAFVFFFQLLYPFAQVNDPRHRRAAAAGGTVLLRRDALERIGGIGALRGGADRRRGAGGGDQAGGPGVPGAQRAGAVRAAVSGGHGRVADGGADGVRAASILAAAAAGDGAGAGAGLAGAPCPGAVRAWGGTVGRRGSLGRVRGFVPADAAAVPAVAALGVGAAGDRDILSVGDAGVRAGPPSRAGRRVEAAGVPGGGGVTASVESWSGKDRGDENFPVGSFLIRPALRPHVHAFYAFARNADDIADSPDLLPEDKVARLDTMEAVLLGRQDGGSPSGTGLRGEPG